MRDTVNIFNTPMKGSDPKHRRVNTIGKNRPLELWPTTCSHFAIAIAIAIVIFSESII